MTAAIRAEGLSKRFGDVQALAGLNLSVPEGSVLALLGPNGAGKTTTVRILTTLAPADHGRAEVLGFDVTRQAHRVRTVIGVGGQDAAVDGSLTGRENLRLVGRLHHFPHRAAHQRADDLLERFGLAQAAERLARTYSGGMRRRLDLAASLVSDPPVLFLDEPTTGLDPGSRLELWAVVEERVAAGTSVMLTTQHLEEADRLAHRIAVVNHGRVVAEGTAEGLKRDSGGEVICVQVVDKSSLDMAAAVLSGVGPGQATINRATGEITIPTPDGMAALAQAARGFDEAQLAIASIELRRPSLDEVFLALTRQHPASAGPPVIVQDHRAVSQDRERTTTRTPPSAAITALRWTVSDTLALAGRTLRHWIRQPQLVLLSTVQPVMLVVLFTYVFGGAVATPGVRYVDFLLPGVMVQVVAWDSTQTAVGIAADRASSIMDRFRSLPICAPAILAGRTLADFCRNVLVVAAMIAVGHLVGFRFQGGAWAAGSAAALVVGFGYAANWLFALIGLTSRGAEAAFAVSLIVVFPLMFASSAMVPPATMPGWLRPFAENQPISLTVNAARALTLGTPIGAELLGALAWIVGLLAIAVPAAVWRFNRVG